MNHLVDNTTSQTCPPFIPIRPTPILRHLYVYTPLVSTICALLVQFPSFIGPCTNLLEHLDINDPKYVDLDVACFMMFTRDYGSFDESKSVSEKFVKGWWLTSCDFWFNNGEGVCWEWCALEGWIQGWVNEYSTWGFWYDINL